MTYKDQPANRSLDGRSEPGDRARPPQELLDNLRLRLSQLADNHPSAPRDQRPETWRDDDDAGPANVAAANHDGEFTQAGGALGGSSGDLHCAVDLTGSEDSAGLARRAGTRAAGWAGGAARAAAGGLGALASMELPSGRRAADPYRPWFMAGEPAAPWWASGPR